MNEGIVLWIDGASRGNPGPASIGVVLTREGDAAPLGTLHRYIGETTNNVAEYTALIYALQEALIRGHRHIQVRTDSELVAKQILGEYKVRDARLRILHDQIQHLRDGFESFSIQAIPREQNQAADRLANEALDQRISQ